MVIIVILKVVLPNIFCRTYETYMFVTLYISLLSFYCQCNVPFAYIYIYIGKYYIDSNYILHDIITYYIDSKVTIKIYINICNKYIYIYND